MKVFICGIIQGSLRGTKIHSQDYRQAISKVLKKHIADLEIHCPVSLHPNSPDYDDKQAARVFEESVEQARSSDLLVAYLPEASMGSAIEMWEAKKANVPIVAITPLKGNWVIRYTADVILETIDEFEDWLAQSGIARISKKA